MVGLSRILFILYVHLKLLFISFSFQKKKTDKKTSSCWVDTTSLKHRMSIANIMLTFCMSELYVSIKKTKKKLRKKKK